MNKPSEAKYNDYAVRGFIHGMNKVIEGQLGNKIAKQIRSSFRKEQSLRDSMSVGVDFSSGKDSTSLSPVKNNSKSSK